MVLSSIAARSLNFLRVSALILICIVLVSIYIIVPPKQRVVKSRNVDYQYPNAVALDGLYPTTKARGFYAERIIS